MISLYRQEKPRAILDQKYSLEPDMATGWIPKLPSCPIPLTYHNDSIREVLLRARTDSIY
jgi:hypothetical protein